VEEPHLLLLAKTMIIAQLSTEGIALMATPNNSTTCMEAWVTNSSSSNLFSIKQQLSTMEVISLIQEEAVVVPLTPINKATTPIIIMSKRSSIIPPHPEVVEVIATQGNPLELMLVVVVITRDACE